MQINLKINYFYPNYTKAVSSQHKSVRGKKYHFWPKDPP